MSTPNASTATRPPAKTYFSNGQALQSPPLSARIRSVFDDIYAFGGLYFVTLFSTDAYAAAQNSQFSTQGRNAMRSGARPSTTGRTMGGGGGGGGSGSGPRTLGNSGGFGFSSGSMDSVRTPGCGSCG